MAETFASAFAGSREHLEEVIELFDLHNEIVIHEGDIGETLPRVLAENPALRFSFVYCDVDAPADRVILANVHDRLSSAVSSSWAEYGWDEFPGQTLAVDDFLREHGGQYESQYLRDTRQPTLALKKIR